MSNRINIIQGDITMLAVDAIVNAANPSLMGGGGVDGAIHRAAGPALKEACRPLRGCHTGFAKITAGYNLKASYVIHAVGPVWNNGTNAEEQLLAAAYRNSMQVALENGLKTIAFPSISTGAYRFPFELATKIARDTILKFMLDHANAPEVTIVAFDDNDYRRMNKIYNEVRV